MKTTLALAVAASALAYAAPGDRPQAADTRRLTIDQLIDIRHPSNPMWSSDGRRVAFLWDRAGVSDWYIADADGKSAPRVALHNDSGGGTPDLSGRAQSLISNPQRSGADGLVALP